MSSMYFVVTESTDNTIIAACHDLESAKDAIKEDYADIAGYGTYDTCYSIIHDTKESYKVSTKISLDVIEEKE